MRNIAMQITQYTTSLPVVIFVKFQNHTRLDQLVDKCFVLFFRSITNINIVRLAQFGFVSNIFLHFGG